jgi:hypothetical protein
MAASSPLPASSPGYARTMRSCCRRPASKKCWHALKKLAFFPCTTLKGPTSVRCLSPGFLLKSGLYGRDLETRPRNLKSLCLGPYTVLPFISCDFCFSAVGYRAKKIKKYELGKKKLIFIASMFTCLALKGFLEF